MFHAQLLHTLDLFGTIVFASTGALIAHEQRRNVFCAMFYAILTALGGGTLRDILLAQQPVFWVRSPAYFWLAGTVGAMIFAWATSAWTAFVKLSRKQFWLADAISLATFTMVGTQVVVQPPTVVLASSLHWMLAPLMGLTTGVGGGLVRDMISGKTPEVIKHPGYILASLVGGVVYDALMGWQVAALFAITLTVILVILVLTVPGQIILKLLPGTHSLF